MANPTAAMIVIGDEILSGRTRDANMHHLAGQLADVGIDLKEVRVVADEHRSIVSAVNHLREAYAMVFTSGGIGPTHDDITADAVAAAFGRNIDVRDDAKRVLAEFCEANGLELTEARLRMARIPEGAELIRNGVSGAPGFTVGNVHVLAGVPAIFRSMLNELLERIPKGRPLVSRTVRVNQPESEIAARLEGLVGKYLQLSFGSYPFREKGRSGANIVVRGEDADAVDRAEAELRESMSDSIA